jgi:DNA-binding transcriptional regulator YhcF (GntR family)
LPKTDANRKKLQNRQILGKRSVLVKNFMFLKEISVTSIAPLVVYPSLISRACATLDESPTFKDVPDGYLRVILRIVKKINLKRLDSPIFASRAKLAQESGKSVETVHRAVRWLEERGLVEREQRARPELRGSTSPLVPTVRLLDALLLSEQAKASVNDKLQPKVPASRPASQSARQESRFERIGKVMLPLDLAWLVKEQGMNCSGVLHLMKLAGHAKQRLSSVVAATKKYLEKM